MAAEARAESPAHAPPPLPVPEKRVVPEDAREERPEPKRRRACVAALDSVPCAASVGGDGKGVVDGHGDGSSFSFQHARGGFVALETTPKFGSFNPPAAAEQAALDPNPAPPAGEDSPQQQEASARGDGEGKGGNSQLVGADGQGQT